MNELIISSHDLVEVETQMPASHPIHVLTSPRRCDEGSGSGRDMTSDSGEESGWSMLILDRRKGPGALEPWWKRESRLYSRILFFQSALFHK